jgi:hypothetical protein
MFHSFFFSLNNNKNNTVEYIHFVLLDTFCRCPLFNSLLTILSTTIFYYYFLGILENLNSIN